MSLVLDDQAIRDAEVFLELAMRFGHDVYAAASDALKQAHPKLVEAVLPPDESGAIAKEAESLIDAKFEPDTDPPPAPKAGS